MSGIFGGEGVWKMPAIAEHGPVVVALNEQIAAKNAQIAELVEALEFVNDFGAPRTAKGRKVWGLVSAALAKVNDPRRQD